MDAALQRVEEGAEDESKEVINHDNEPSDDDNVGTLFRKKMDEKKEPPKEEEKAIRRRRTKGPDDAGPARAKATASKRKHDAEMASLIDSASSSLSSLESVTPMSVFQGTVRIKEVDKRLSLAHQALSNLEDHLPDNAAAQDIMVRSCLKQRWCAPHGWMCWLASWTVESWGTLRA